MHTRVASSNPGVFRFLSTKYFLVAVVSFRHNHVAAYHFDARGITWLRNSSVYEGGEFKSWRGGEFEPWRDLISFLIVSCCCCFVCFYIENHSDNRLPLLLPAKREKERSSMSRGVTTRAMATPDSASRSEESVKARHRGLRADRH